MTESDFKIITDKILSYSNADETEVVLLSEETGLTRFADSSIHQNVMESNVEIRVRAILDKRIGVASINNFTDESLKGVVKRASDIARVQGENPDFPSLPQHENYRSMETFSDSTAGYSPYKRAIIVNMISKITSENHLRAYGQFSTSAYSIAVANSSGVRAFHRMAQAEIKIIAMSDTSSGYSDYIAIDADEIDFEALAKESVEKAIRGVNPITLTEGEYEVVLEEYAVAELINYLAYLGWSALSVQEGRSFMQGNIGNKIMSGDVNIWDDGLDLEGLPMPFDFEGVPKKRVDFIRNGVACDVVYDTICAAREGKKSTGHALPAPNSEGPLPLNIFMAPGTILKRELPESIKKGIWVTRFHYVNPVHPIKSILTGMTRDGTYLIENGELTKGVRNFRFTQSIVDAFSKISGISENTKLQRSWWGGTRVPAIKISSFTFTGSTV